MRKIIFWFTVILGPLNVVALLLALKFTGSLSIPILSIGYLILSLRKIGPTERGLITLFGRPISNVESGLYLIPWLICELITFSRNLQQLELPGKPEKIWDAKNNEGKELPIPSPNDEGWILPIRINFDNSNPDPDPDLSHETGGLPPPATTVAMKEGDPLTRRITVKVQIIVIYQVTDPQKFITSFGQIKTAEKTITDMAIVEMTNVLQKGTLARAQSYADKLCEIVLKRLIANILEMKGSKSGFDSTKAETMKLDKLLKPLGNYLGCRIVKVQFKPFGLSHDLNKEIQSMVEAVAKAEAAKTEAKGEKVKLAEEGEGRATALAAEFKAKALGLRQLATEMRKPEGRNAMTLETVSKVMSEGNKVVITGDNGLGNLIAGVKAISDSLAITTPTRPEEGGEE